MRSSFAPRIGIVIGAGMVVVAAWLAIEVEPRDAQAGFAVVGLVLVGLGLSSLGAGPQERPDRRFLAWLRDHERQVLAGTALYEDVRITPDTRLVRFSYVVSVLVLTLRTRTRYYVEGVEPTGLMNAVYTLITLALGWWGVPWGPIYTLQVVHSNLTRRDSVSVGDILHSFAAEEEPKPEAR